MNFKAIRYESTSFSRIVADKLLRKLKPWLISLSKRKAPSFESEPSLLFKSTFYSELQVYQRQIILYSDTSVLSEIDIDPFGFQATDSVVDEAAPEFYFFGDDGNT